MSSIKIMIAFLLLAASSQSSVSHTQPLLNLAANDSESYSCLSDAEHELASIVNEYRQEYGLPAVPVSRTLTRIARLHALDLHFNRPHEAGRNCTLHSWSAGYSWTPVCYTADHRFAQQMWRKGLEISGGKYTGTTYENAYWTTGPIVPSRVLEAWKRSPSHDALLSESGDWSGTQFQAMGVGTYGNAAVLWFGDKSDRAPILPLCQSK